MNRNRGWNPTIRGRGRGGFNRGGRGGNRGWFMNRGGYNGPNNYSQGYGGNRFQKDFQPHFKQWKKPDMKREKRDTPGKRLSEDLIGVTEYISDHEGFNGIIKSRYSDFQVSEMNEKGEIAQLTTKKPPARPTEESVDDDEDLLLNKYNLEILAMETWDKINSLTVNTAGGDPESQRVEIDMEGVSKEQRTKIHDAVKKAFGDSIVGSTVNVGDKKFMRFEKYRKGVRIDNRVKWVWPGDFVHFVVHKENCDTLDAAARIAEKIGVHMKPSTIGYAGTKDRRAKTSQWFSLKRTDPARVAAACRSLRDVHVGNYSFSDRHLKLGMLKGNKFRIALRNVTAPQSCVEAACALLRDRGFINYYGLQRFGSRIDTPTFDIGLKLLQGKFKEAIDAILEPRAGPLEQVLAVNRASGASAAAALLPRRAAASTHSEARLIRALADAPNDLVGALGKLARNIRLLYLHSYQSLVWNRAVSERLRRHGLAPAPGDCVPLTGAHLTDSNQESESEDEEEGDGSASHDTSTTSETEAHTKHNKTEGDKTEGEPKPPLAVKILTAEDVDSGRYSVFDVVLPLPGAAVLYPPNMIDFYEELLTKDGLKMDMKHKLKSYNMSGAYRHMVVRPLSVSWQHARYSDPFADLIPSDLDLMENRPVTGIIDDGKYRALILNMILPSSCYATMALRELLKVDTSSDNQALQNNYHKKNKGEKKESVSESEKTEQSETEDKDKLESGENSSEKKQADETDAVEENNKESETENDSEAKSGEKRKLEEGSDETAKKVKTDE